MTDDQRLRLVGGTTVTGDRTPLGPIKSNGGDGGGMSGDLEHRVKSLEDDMKKLLQDTAEIKGMLRSAPSAIEFGELKGRVNSLPTTAKAATLLSLAVAAIAIINNWATIKALF